MRILVGGGTGFVGKHLKSLLVKKGHEVTNISRSAKPGAMTWEDLENYGFPENTDGVVNLTGENVMKFRSFDPEFKLELRNSRIQSTKWIRNIIEKSDKPPKVFVCASAIGFYKASDTAEYTEDSPCGDDFMSLLCQDWEKAACLPDSVKCRSVRVRIGLACGRDGGAVQSMVYPFFFGAGGRLGSGKQWFPWVHVDDVAGIIAHSIENEHVTGVLNAVAPQPASNEEFTKAFASALNRPAIFPVPSFVINTILGPERGSMLLEGSKIIPKKTLESGYTFKYPDLKSACKEFAHLF